MSVLDDVLKEEYDLSIRIKKALKKELEQLPKGYISQKSYPRLSMELKNANNLNNL